ncbi:hypothetical protein DEHALATV1_0060 [Dehalococcoides mccartyi]|uniref:Uncharacterized protein n=1 Tax=Dehalococcoides mccartyi TaxID=61435 RepID=A0AB33HN32_9CHLR|nr:hypothetical protein [Dehalococcoides mccartyi]BAZ96688.1 hypothetical protein DEHALATV1_0060 [Dehalococcoides mccartyi]
MCDILYGRFLQHSNYFAKTLNLVKAGAFVPSPKTSNLSVWEIDKLEKSDVYDLGQKHVINDKIRHLYGYAKIQKSSFITQGLCVAHDNPKIPKHANITNWPEEAKLNDITHKLATASTLELF